MIRLMRFNESSGLPKFTESSPADTPRDPWDIVGEGQVVRKVVTPGGEEQSVILTPSGKGIKPPTIPWRKVLRTLREVLSHVRTAGASGLVKLYVRYLDVDDDKGVAAEGPGKPPPDDRVSWSSHQGGMVKETELSWGESGGSKGDRVLDSLTARMSRREIMRVSIVLATRYNSVLWLFRPVGDDYTWMVLWSADGSVHRYTCDEARGGTVEAVRHAGLGPGSDRLTRRRGGNAT